MSAQAAPVPQRRGELAVPAADSIAWLYALIALLGAMHLSMLLGRSINWDEFWYYSQVQTLARSGTLPPLQTIHTRAFYWWLPAMPGSEIDHILIARLFMFACLGVIAAGIVAIAQGLTDRRTALLAASLYLGAGYVLQHGTSFRVDPILSALLVSALAIGARSRMGPGAILAMGALTGLAAMVSIKFVLWAPAFAGIALWRWQERGFEQLYPPRWIAAGAVAAGVFLALYAWHGGDVAGDAAGEVATRTLDRSLSRMFGFLANPRPDLVVKGIALSLPLVIAAALVPLRAVTMKAPWAGRLAILLLWSTIAVPFFYHNAFPYFYTFILPPVAIACAISIPVIAKRYGPVPLAALTLMNAAAVWVADPRGTIENQRVLVESVHEIVPRPVHYFDRSGVIGRFIKANGFLSRWGIDNYRATGRPLLLERMREGPVPLLIDDRSWFASAFDGSEDGELHPADAAALRETFVRHWGPVYLAGRALDPGERIAWRVLVPGPYTAEGTLQVDGREYETGDTVELGRGTVALANKGPAPARLVWGENLRTPRSPPPSHYWNRF